MTSSIEIRFPEDQQEGTEATVTRWLISEGDRVAAHDPVVEIETDKVVVEVAAPQAGLIGQIKIQQDEEVNPGDVLCTLNTETAADIKAEPLSETEQSVSKYVLHRGGARLSPAVRQRVLQHGLDLDGIAGSGRDGRITLQDVEALVTRLKHGQEIGTQEVCAGSVPTIQTEGSSIVPHDKMRKRIADNMVTSLLQTAPHVTAVFEADLSAVMRHRASNKEAFANAGTPLTLTVYFVAASIAAIQKVPRVNSRWFDDHLEIFQNINIGIGTALGDRGLIVPVVRDAPKPGS